MGTDSEKQKSYWCFLDRLATTEPESWTDAERSLDHVLEYQHQVLNGGHLQYFHNQTVRIERPFELCIAALREIGCDEVAEILEQAVMRWDAEPRTAPWSLEEFSSEAMAEEFSNLDMQFYTADPELQSRLETVVLELSKQT